MTNTMASSEKRKPSNGFVIVFIITFLIISFSALLHFAYQHGASSAYSTGYEMGDMLANIFSSGAFKNGIGLGSILAVLTSWERNKSILWAILHAIFGWAYVIYFVLTRKKGE